MRNYKVKVNEDKKQDQKYEKVKVHKRQNIIQLNDFDYSAEEKEEKSDEIV